jgi:hypothetical protein
VSEPGCMTPSRKHDTQWYCQGVQVSIAQASAREIEKVGVSGALYLLLLREKSSLVMKSGGENGS